MFHKFDASGWYVGEVEAAEDRTTELVPDNLDTALVDGQLHANFTGYRWVELPYVAPPAPVVPASVTMRQARLALLAAGKLAAVDAAITAMPSPQKEQAQIQWEYSSDVFRDWPLVMSLGPALGLSSADLDALFIQAATL